jgi:DHA2 family multidrug resistance protein
LKAAFQAQGADAVTATERARLALFGMVQREAMMLSFTDIFRWLSLMFLAMLPLLLLMRSPKRRGGAAGAAH